jgi:hypothetical protein
MVASPPMLTMPTSSTWSSLQSTPSDTPSSNYKYVRLVCWVNKHGFETTTRSPIIGAAIFNDNLWYMIGTSQ